MDVSPLIRDRPGTGFEFERFPTLPRFLIGIAAFLRADFLHKYFVFSFIVFVLIGQYRRVPCTKFLRSLVRSKLADHALKYTVEISAMKLISKIILRYEMRCFEIHFHDSCTIISAKILSSIFAESFHSLYVSLYKSWRNFLNSFVFPNLFPINFSRLDKLLTLSYHKHARKRILDAIDKSFKPVSLQRIRKKEIAEQNE